MVVVEVVVVWICWLQGTGAEWQEEQEESLSEQLESNTHTLPSNPAVPSYLTQLMYNFDYILRNDLVLTITDKVGLTQKLSDIDTVLGVFLTIYQV